MPSFVTATLSRALDVEEEALVLGSLEILSAFGQPILTAHGKSSPECAERLRRIPHLEMVPFTPEPGPLAQVRSSLQEARTRGVEWIFYTEPDKGWFFAHRLRELLLAAEEVGPDVGIVMPSRNEASFATFPAEQQLTERLTNQLITEVLGQAGDFVYGPFLLRPELIDDLGSVPNDLGWGWRPFLMATAHRHGLRIATLSLDLPCPVSQRNERKLNYRLEQMAQNVRGLSLGLRP